MGFLTQGRTNEVVRLPYEGQGLMRLGQCREARGQMAPWDSERGGGIRRQVEKQRPPPQAKGLMR